MTDSLIGLGIDIVDMAQFGALYGDRDPEMLERCFLRSELVACGDGPNSLSRLASRLAAKEAVFKALTADAAVSHLDIEIIGDSGPPSAVLHGSAHKMARAKGISTILVSLAHASSSVAAVAVALGETAEI